MLFDADKPQPGTGGTVTLWANGEVIGEGKMAHTVPVAFSSYAVWTSAATTGSSSTSATRTRLRTPLPER